MGADSVSVALGITIAVRVGASTVFVLMRMGVAVGCSSEVTMIMGGNGVGCGGWFSANESEIPPTTNKREMMAIRTPPPI